MSTRTICGVISLNFFGDDIIRRRKRQNNISSPIIKLPYKIKELNFKAMIEIKNLGKTFKTSFGTVKALDNINLTINDGEIFGIIGLSGAGKSTLVRCINLLERPTEGDVVLDGKSLTALSKKELLKVRQSIGMIFQGFNLLEQRNVLKNVCYPLEIAGVKKAEAEKKAKELIELVGLSDRILSYPSQLSGGQKQRVAIARALATNPKYILCDEATSALDPNTTQSILELLKQINKTMGVTIVVITHEMKVIEQICDRVAVIDNSKIAEFGKVSTVFSSPKSEIAKELILPKNNTNACITGKKSIRIVFDGEKSRRSVIADMILSTQVPVNIMFADTKDIDGIAYGHMILELPDDDVQAGKIFAYLDSNGISYEMEV